VKSLKTATDVKELVTSFRYAEVLMTAFDMGIFAVISSNGPQTLDQLSEASEAYPRSLAMLLNACVAMGLLNLTTDSKYDVTELSQSTLTPGSPHFLGNFIRLQRDVRLRWDRLRDGVEFNHRVNPERRNREDGSEWGWNHQFILGLHDAAREVAGPVAQSLAPLLQRYNVKQMVDIGAGSGTYAAALVSAMPELNIRLYELAGPLEITNELLVNFPQRDRLELYPSNFQTDPIGQEKEYDAAMLFGVLHSENKEGQTKLLGKISDALKPGGLLILRTPFLDPNRVSPSRATLDALQTLISTNSGEVPTWQGLQKLLQEAGFGAGRIRHVPTTDIQLVYCTRRKSRAKRQSAATPELCEV